MNLEQFFVRGDSRLSEAEQDAVLFELAKLVQTLQDRVEQLEVEVDQLKLETVNPAGNPVRVGSPGKSRRYLILKQLIEAGNPQETTILELNTTSPNEGGEYQSPVSGPNWSTTLLDEYPDEQAARTALHQFAGYEGWTVERVPALPDYCEQWRRVTP